jgi:hypothetical protein
MTCFLRQRLASWCSRRAPPVGSADRPRTRRAGGHAGLRLRADAGGGGQREMYGDPGGIRTLDLQRERLACWASAPQGQATFMLPPWRSGANLATRSGRAFVHDGRSLPPGRAATQRRDVPLVDPPACAKDEGAPKDQYRCRRRFEDHHDSPPGTQGYRVTSPVGVHTFVFFSYRAKSIRLS